MLVSCVVVVIKAVLGGPLVEIESLLVYKVLLCDVCGWLGLACFVYYSRFS